MPAEAHAQTDRRLSSRDLLNFTFVSDPRISPDGDCIAWVQTIMDKDRNTYRSCIYVAAGDGTGARPFTAGQGRDTAPRWSPDGRWLAFLSNRPLPGGAGPGGSGREKDREGPAQLWLMPADGGESFPLTRLRYGAGPALWSPDSRRIAFIAPVGPDGPEPPKGEGAGTAAANDGASGGAGDGNHGQDREPDPDPYTRFNEDVLVIKRAFFKLDGTGFFKDRRRHLLVVDVDGPGTAPGPARAVTAGEYDVAGAAWAPGGSGLAVVTNMDPEADYQHWQDLHFFSLEGGEPVRLTGGRGPIRGPAYTPDGRTLAYLGHDDRRGWYTRTRLYLLPAEGGEPRCVTDDLDLDLGDESISDMRDVGGGIEPVWTPDGDALWLPASRHGTTHLFRIDTADGSAHPITTGERVIYGASFSADGRRVAFTASDPLCPGDVFVTEVGGDAGPPGESAEGDAAGTSGDTPAVSERRVTAVNDDLLARFDLSRPEEFSFTAAPGVQVQAWAMRPVGAGPGARHPTVLQIHGGPAAMYAWAFFFEFQLLAARGYAVVYGNPRGSRGYGEDFCAAIRGDWGNLDHADVMATIDQAVERFDFIDPERLGVAGGSYGGFMTNWIIGRSDRFRAAVTMRSVVNEYSMYGTSDIGHNIDRDFGGLPWEVPGSYLDKSPIAHIKDCKTPTLVIHAEQDHRCPVEQGEQLFRALKRLGVPTEFVRFPNESHGLSRGGRPWHRVFRLDHIVDWFDRYLR